VETASYKAQRTISYHLQPEFLDQLWATIRQTIEGAPGLYDDFREPQLFFSAKGTKLLFKTSPSRPTIVDAMENFASYFDRNMDLSFIDPSRLWIDVAKEICPRVSLLCAAWPRRRRGPGVQLETVLP
jgi:hypothetical protein